MTYIAAARRRLSKLALGGALLAMLSGVGIPASAQQSPASSVVLSAVQVDGNNASLSASVVDAAGNAVGSLPAAAFATSIDGAPVALESADPTLDPALTLGLVVVIDTSGSMIGPALDAAKVAVANLVASTQPGDHVALITFSSTVVTQAPFATDRKPINDAVVGLRASGNTALYAAVSQAANLSAAAPDPRKAVVLLTDGEDFGDASQGITRDSSLSTAISTGVPFYVVGLGNEVDMSFLSTLGSKTGGNYFPAANPGDLATLYQNISERLRTQYTLRFTLPDGLAGGGHRLRVTVGGASAEASFTKVGTGSVPTFEGLEAPIAEARLVNVAGLPANALAEFTIDGKPIPTEAGAHAIRIDPYTFDPAASHTITVAYASGDGPRTLTRDFAIAALPPTLLSPNSLPNLRPGDLVRFTVQAQPGAVHAIYSLDGQEAARSDGPTFEYTLPANDVAAGSHTFTVAFEGAAGRTEQSFSFEGPAKGGSPTGAYILIALAVLAAAATLLYGGHLVLARVGSRREKPVDLDAGAHIKPRAGGSDSYAPDASPVVVDGPAAAIPWGIIVVMNGKQAGQRFVLRADRELAGSGRSCSIRLKESSVQPAHAVLTREPLPTITRSAPNCPVIVDGKEAREAPLVPGSVIHLGNVELRFELPLQQDSP